MLFTIAIPAYNSAKVIKPAIESVITQTYKGEYEILIVNNASKDETLKVVDEFQDNRIRVITNETTVDLFANHNICLKEAHGEYVLFCHSDDTLQEYALSVLSDELTRLKHPQKIILWGKSLFRDGACFIKRANYNYNTVFCGDDAHRAFIFGGLTPSGTCYSRKSILEIGGFPEMKNRITPLDWYILQYATFNNFEFEMIDRLLFIRKYASTAVSSLTWKDWTKANGDAFNILMGKLTEDQKQKIIECFYLWAPLESFSYIKKSFNWKQKVKFIINRSGIRLFNPKFFKHLINHLTFKYMKVPVG